MSINKLDGLIIEENLKMKLNNSEFQISQLDYHIEKDKLFPIVSFGARQYTLNGFTQSTEGNFVDVNKNNEFRGLSIAVKWNLSNIVFNLSSADQSRKAAFYKKESLNIDFTLCEFSIN